MFRFRNFVLGCTVGTFTALVLFAAGFAIRGSRWPIPMEAKTAIDFFHFIHWGWFVAIVLLGGVWGFLFNNKLGEEISRTQRRSGIFRD
jgi:hypothetical protein